MNSNKKRILFVFAILTMALVLSFVFVACGTDADKQKRQFTITFDTQGGSEVKPITIAEGTTITLPRNPTKEGFLFDGWYLSDAFVEKFVATKTITGDITLYAKWIEDNGQEEPPVAKTYSITFMVDGVTYKTFNIAEGSVITLPENPGKKCCIFEGWYIDEDLLEKFNATQDISQDIVVYAKWSDNHTVVEDSEVPATCTTAGLTAGKHCSVCNEILKAQTEIPALGHDFSKEWTIDKEATCTEKGSKSHHCTRCEVKSDETEIPTKEHSESNWIIDKEATCTEDGSKHTECTVCHTTIKTEKISALGHTDVIDNAVEPTCTTSGLTQGKHCSTCGKILQAQTEIPALGHDIVHHEAKSPTCTEPGWEAYDTCKRDGCTYTTYKEIPALGHTGGTATCTEQATCEKCNAKYGELAKHKYKDGVCIVCGNRRPSEGLDYFLNSDGTSYTVMGIGTCPDKEIIIPSEYDAKPVTSISSYAFNNCAGLTSVTIPNSVTSIGSYAFSGCSSLESITIPFVGAKAGVTSSDTYQYPFGYIFGTYSYTGGVATNQYYYGSSTSSTTDTTYYIPSSLKSVTVTGGNILYGAFYNCSGLTSVTIGASVTSIGTWAFEGCAGLTSITIPDSVTSIGGSAFSGCTGLTSVTIGNSVTSIGDFAFYGCTGLTSITIPDSVTSIGNSAFKNCTGLTSVTIGNSVTSIVGAAFDGCDKLQDIYITDIAAWCNISGLNSLMCYGSNNKKLYINNELATSITIPNGVTVIPSCAFNSCTGLTSIIIPDSVTSIGSGAFYNTAWYNNQPDGLVYAGKVAYQYKGTMPSNTSIVIKEGTLGIAGYAFEYCSGLTSITIPDSVTSIGDYAFSHCTGLTSITIPDSVTSIGERAFAGCTWLTSITIPDSVTSIGERAFSGCTGLTSIIVVEGNSKYHSAGNCLIETATKTLILGCETSVIPTDGSVTSIGDCAFDGCSGLTSITIPDSVTSIGSNAFYNCTWLTSVTIGNGVTSIGQTAFGNTAWYNNQPDGLVYAGKVAYKYKGTMPSNTSIVLKEGTLGITGYAFAYCSELTSITIPDSVTSIGSNAFYYCSGLTSITIPNNVTSIGSEAFYGCTRLTSITIPDSVTSIGRSAFNGCKGLTSVTIGNSVTSIGGGAFFGCSGLTRIAFNGTIAQWNAIEKASSWKSNVRATEVVCTDGTVSI